MKNNVAIITGSVRGIGKAIAEKLAAQGARVVLNSVNTVEEGKALAAELPDAIYVQGDVSDEAFCKVLIQAALDAYGQLDILVNNVGKSMQVPYDDMAANSTELFHELYQTNVLSAWYLSMHALPHLRKSQDGNILNISSIAGLKPVGSSIPYGLSKAALNHLSSYFANLGAPDVRVNTVAPGFVITDRTRDWAEFNPKFSEGALVGRAGQPEEIASVVMGVLASGFMTGECVAVDGGFCFKAS